MSNDYEPSERFRVTKAYLEALTAWLDVQENQQAVVVDVPEVEVQATIFAQRVDELRMVALERENGQVLAQALAMLQAAAQSVRVACEDVEKQLEDLLNLVRESDVERDS